MTGPPAPEQPRHIATRDGLLVLLTLTTGAVDASSFLHLGNVFSSVITGNLVLLGLSAATGPATTNGPGPGTAEPQPAPAVSDHGGG